MIDSRQKQLLKAIIEQYIETGQPVGSAALAEEASINLSPATIRNEMMALEQLGLVGQPFTSAGRVPTIKGWKYYIDSLMDLEQAEEEANSLMSRVREQSNLKELALYVSTITDGAVLVGKGDYRFVTGLGRLFAQPEFEDLERIVSLSSLVDDLDSLFDRLEILAENEPQIFIGRGNPFGSFCSTFLVSKGQAEPTIFSLVTPLCTNYPRNISIMQEAIKFLN